MYTLRSVVIGAACILSMAAGPALAGSDTDSGTGSSGYGNTSMMGAATGGMMGSGSGWMTGGFSSGHGQLGDQFLDQLGDRIAQRYDLMQRIASEKDKKARRDLVRQYVENAHQGYWEHEPGYGFHQRSQGWGRMGCSPMAYGRMGPWMMGRGMMGYGMMGPTGYGMMGPMGYGMMGPMGYGMGYGYGRMGPGMMGYGPQGYGWMRGGWSGQGLASQDHFSDEQLDHISKQMADNYAFRQKLAQTTDESQRRKLIREHLNNIQEFLENMYSEH